MVALVMVMEPVFPAANAVTLRVSVSARTKRIANTLFIMDFLSKF